MRLVFNTFARAFFEEPDQISMAQLIKGFHFYFLSNDLGLIYDVLDDDFEFSLLNISDILATTCTFLICCFPIALFLKFKLLNFQDIDMNEIYTEK